MKNDLIYSHIKLDLHVLSDVVSGSVKIHEYNTMGLILNTSFVYDEVLIQKYNHYMACEKMYEMIV